MDSGPTLKRKVTVKLNYNTPSTSSRPPSRHNVTNVPRPASPVKSYVSTNAPSEPTPFRPKAKVNSSATRKAATTTSASASSTPRAGSPAKLTPRIRNGALSPTQHHKAQSALGTSSRSPTPVSAPGTPEIRHRSLTTSESGSLHHAVSFSSFQPSDMTNVNMSARNRLLPSKSVIGLSDREQTSSPSMRIRSKVSGMAKSASESPSLGSSSPLLPSTRPTQPHSRTPSVSSNTYQPPTSPPQQFYPITTATSAANPHRFAQTRPVSSRTSPTIVHSTFQSFSQPSDERPRLYNGVAKVDPAFIPLPPHSPPASAVSFSSRSSLSRSSATDSRLSPVTPQTPQIKDGNTDHLRSTLDNLLQYSSMHSGEENYSGDSGQDRDTDGEIGDEGRKVKAEAKSNRKIADLEITNKSLLAINASLETTKRRQGREISELRRKLRESRLILPPSAFRAVKSSQEPAQAPDDEEDLDDTSEGEDLVAGGGDEIYRRIKLILDNLLQSGQRALERQAKDYPEGGKGGAKVLSAEELQDWHGSKDNDHDHDGASDHETQSTLDVEKDELRHGFPPNQQSELSFNDDSLASEDEVEAITLPTTSPPTSPRPPPILVTQPTS
ncbi:hypothetical protein B0H34DRAFT_13708 [Crassisporium funariophilum]|nr:hypothetical protein B0H34DRAFT_13708 [Crassisporium funariophilum]